MWKQTKNPNLDPVIYQGGRALTNWAGWCLAYVQTAFGAGWAGASAWDSWSSAQGKHADRNVPSGVYVPIWFSHTGTYGGVRKNWGHVAIYKDGKIWTSPASNKPYADVFNSIADIERVFSSQYVGWSEFVGPTRVIEYVNNNITLPQLQAIFRELLKREPDQGAINHYVGRYTEAFVRNDVANSAERKQLLANEAAQARATWIQAIKDFYREILGREADQGGIDHYLSQISKGWQYEDIRRDLLNSTERKQYVANLEAAKKAAEAKAAAEKAAEEKKAKEEAEKKAAEEAAKASANKELEGRVSALEKIVQKIVEFLSGLFKGFNK